MLKIRQSTLGREEEGKNKRVRKSRGTPRSKKDEKEAVHDTPADAHTVAYAPTAGTRENHEEEGAAGRSCYGLAINLPFHVPLHCWWGGIRSEEVNLS